MMRTMMMMMEPIAMMKRRRMLLPLMMKNANLLLKAIEYSQQAAKKMRGTKVRKTKGNDNLDTKNEFRNIKKLIHKQKNVYLKKY